MQTSVIGYPRIGTLRELKFALEKYFRKEITDAELQATAKELRAVHWQSQKDAGIDFIPSNDFSFYDIVLDSAFLFNIVPDRYKKLELSELDTYLAMARGYQGESGDVKALAMKKWFNTNYHYIVPEIEDDTEVKLTGDKLIREYKEAKADGTETKPMITGAYTLLKLCRYTGEKTAADFVDAFAATYKDLLAKCESENVKWIQFDEPALVWDMTADDIEVFKRLYKEILSVKSDCKVLLQTYFGDVRDVYEELTALPFDGIGLDFIEGKQTLQLVEKYGFPKDKLLFAGLVNGKNIWKNHYAKTLAVLAELKEKGINTVLSTSCSLLHVPYTLAHEKKLSEGFLRYFAFAEEKLTELSELKQLAELDIKNDNFSGNEKNASESEILERYKANGDLFSGSRDCRNEAVAERLSKVTEDDYIRLPKRAERQKLQKALFGLPEFPTTTIGSFPQTKDVKANRSAFKRGEITEEQYVDFNKKKIEECVKWQEEIGLDVLVHGEYERNDMV